MDDPNRPVTVSEMNAAIDAALAKLRKEMFQFLDAGQTQLVSMVRDLEHGYRP